MCLDPRRKRRPQSSQDPHALMIISPHERRGYTSLPFARIRGLTVGPKTRLQLVGIGGRHEKSKKIVECFMKRPKTNDVDAKTTEIMVSTVQKSGRIQNVRSRLPAGATVIKATPIPPGIILKQPRRTQNVFFCSVRGHVTM